MANPTAVNCYADVSGAPTVGGPAGGTCAHCALPKAAHDWLCGCCGRVLSPGDVSPTLHSLQRNGCVVRTPYLVCPIGAARTSSAYGGASGGASGVASKPPPKNYGPLPKPPALSAGPITVDEAWALFGIPQKRGRKEDVKKRSLEFVFKHHPDKAKTKKQKDTASAQLTRANLAWSLLEKHCKW